MKSKIQNLKQLKNTIVFKSLLSVGLIGFALSVNELKAQNVHQTAVPSVVVNKFQKSFPKASDVEWKLEGDKYKVEFETGLLGKDHDAWFDKNGNLVRYKKEISKSELPKGVLSKIKSDFNSYRVDDVEKLMQGTGTTYKVELKSFSKKWKVIFDDKGNVLSKVID